MNDRPSLAPDIVAHHLREARDLRGAAIRALFASAVRTTARSGRNLARATSSRLHRRRLVFAPRLACQ